MLVGFAVMLAGGAPLARWGVHLVSALLGWFAYLIVRRLPGDGGWTGSRWVALASVAVIGSTLLGASVDGVLRWHLIGPLRIHCSALLAPVLIVAAAGAVRARPVATGLCLTACQLVHVAQPDAGQATALGVAAAWLLLKEASLPVARALGIANAAAIAIAWMRPDPLPPAPFVEDIIAVAFRSAPLLGVVALLSMIPVVIAPLAPTHAAAATTGKSARVSLALYLAGTIVVPVFGEFPVPLLGFGPSPVVGAFLGLAALDALVRRHPVAAGSGAPSSSKPTDASRTGARIAGLCGVQLVRQRA
ncbi:MAG TPA: hypothetical protein VFZ53_29625 [Polyangiaceae bacterium]